MFTKLVTDIIILHRDAILRWKKTDTIQLTTYDFLRLVEENHAFNFQLWQAEDRARREDKGFEFVYHAKRAIDHFNQQRNNRMEAMDEWLYRQLQPTDAQTTPVHSETPGMIIDRLSILALKSYHMELQTTRVDVDHHHRQHCQHKLDTLRAQLSQLQTCLHELLTAIQQKTRTFLVYHQFKMYNDPTLNPELYNQGQET